MRRTGLRRHGRLEESAGDPLDGLVNLFDIGIVLAIAFLVAGLSFAVDHKSGREQSQKQVAKERVLPRQGRAPRARGQGRPVGTAYRLADGRLVIVSPR
jgi:hypothetical protein